MALTGSRGCLLDVSMHDVAVAAAQPIAEPRARVANDGEQWLVSSAGELEVVTTPVCRAPAGIAAEMGRDTEALRADFGRP